MCQFDQGCIVIQFKDSEAGGGIHNMLQERLKSGSLSSGSKGPSIPGKSQFEQKTEATSSELYFNYYGMIMCVWGSQEIKLHCLMS